MNITVIWADRCRTTEKASLAKDISCVHSNIISQVGKVPRREHFWTNGAGFYKEDVIAVTQPTAWKHWRETAMHTIC